MSVELTLSFPNTDDPAVAAEQLKHAFSALDKAADSGEDLKLSLPLFLDQHEDWEWGDPCPECGCENLCVGEITYDKCVADGEFLSHVERLDFQGGTHCVSCLNDECMIDIYRTPAHYLAEK